MNSVQRVAARYLQAGTVTRNVRGSGWDVHEAWGNAMQNDVEDNGREYGGENNLRDAGPAKMVKAPKKPTKVTITKKDVTKGPVTKKFVIERRWGWSRDTPSAIERDKRYTAQYDTQGTVLAAAKDLALQYGEELKISLQAFCVGNTHLADVVPEKGEKGLWSWQASFRD